MIFQYIVPILLVTVAHARICFKLKYRMVNQQNKALTTQSAFLAQKKAAEKRRKRKTNIMLVAIAVVFACSWMPLNVFNIMADFNPALLTRIDKRGLIIPLCHLLVLTSACINPVLYGWLNENFRKEFVKVFWCCKLRQSRHRQQQRQQQQKQSRRQHQRGETHAVIVEEETVPCTMATRIATPAARDCIAETSVHFDVNGGTTDVQIDVHNDASIANGHA